jgi:Domain of unknown function (DUF4124)
MKRFIVLALACVFAPLAGAQLYKYVDKDGKTVYSDQPPANIDSKQINVQSGVSRDTPSPASSGPKTAIERDKELQKTRDELKERNKKSDEVARIAQGKAEACENAKNAYQGYVDGGRVHKYVNGERVFLGDEELAAELVRSKREMDEACKK